MENLNCTGAKTAQCCIAQTLSPLPAWTLGKSFTAMQCLYRGRLVLQMDRHNRKSLAGCLAFKGLYRPNRDRQTCLKTKLDGIVYRHD